jgi:hypothetical protein
MPFANTFTAFIVVFVCGCNLAGRRPAQEKT